MTDERRPTDWADDRLAAAFAARSASQTTPSDLISSTLERVRVAPRLTLGRFGFVHLAGAAAAAVVLAVVAVGVFGPRPTAEPGETHAATFGLEPITVSEAIAIRDAGIDDREVAVSGYYVTAGPIRCRSDGSNNPTRPWCPGLLAWVMEKPEAIDVPAVRSSGATPAGPAIQSPSLALVHPSGLPPTPGVVTPVRFIGHFDDRRAAFCTADERISCADTFVVDHIAMIDGQVVRTTTVSDIDSQPQSTEDSIDERVRHIVPNAQILARRITTIGQLGSAEPLFVGRRGSPSHIQSIHWLVTALPSVDSAGRAGVRTFLIPDEGSDPILEITRDGELPVTESAPPEASPTEAPTTTIVGDPITVAEAIDHRDNHLDDTEMAIDGFWLDRSGALRCALVSHTSPLEPSCQWRWLTESRSAADATFTRPDGPAIQPVLDPGAYLDPEVNGRAFEGTPAIAIGHFDDRRASLCEASRFETCRRVFVIDALLGRPDTTIAAADLEIVRPDGGAHPLSSVSAVISLAGVPDGLAVLSAYPVRRATLAKIEPAVATAPELERVNIVWIVRYVDRESGTGRAIVRTVLVPDRDTVSLGWPVAYELTETGLVRRQPASSLSVANETVICGFLSENDCQAAAAAVIEAIVGEPRRALTIEMSAGLYCAIPDVADTSCPGTPLPWRGGAAIGSALVSYEGEGAKSYLNLYRDTTGIYARFIQTAIEPG